MMNQATLRYAAPLLALFASSFAPPEEVLKATDHKKLGKLIGEYFEARMEEEGITESLEKIKENLDKIQKKVKGRDPLSLVEDLEMAVFYANDYGSKRTKGKGKLDTVELDHPYFGALELAVHAPKKYSGKAGPYPMVLCIPDAGQAPREHIERDWINADLRAKAVLVAVTMPEDLDRWTSLGEPQNAGGLGVVMATYGSLTKDYAIDMDRVYLAGRGAGVEAAMAIAAQYPHCFAGVIGRTGDMGETPITNFRNTATYFSGAGANSTAFEKAAAEAEYANCTVDPQGTEEEVLAWIENTQRNPMPSKLEFQPATLQSNRSFWLQLDGFEPGAANISAAVDRETNTIEITSEAVVAVRLYFNDLLVDLDAPVRVVINGTLHEDLLPRNFQVMLANAFGNGDTGRIFTASKLYDVPSPAPQ